MDIDRDWTLRYQPASRLVWRGRRDGPGATRFHEITRFIDLREGLPEPEYEDSYAFVGFACDAGIQRNFGRAGADMGPEAAKQALSNIPIQNEGPLALYDVGAITCLDGNLEESQHALSEVVALLLLHKFKPVVLGGGHETAWGHFQGIAKHLGQERVGVVNLDAHFDLRPLLDNDLGSSGTPFLQIAKERQRRGLPFQYRVIGIQRFGNTPALFQLARELGVEYVLADEIHTEGLLGAHDMIDSLLAQVEGVYLSVDLDVFANYVAPGVSAPQPLGLRPWQIIPLIKQLAQSGKVVSMDVCELSPSHDRDDMTAALTASLIAGYIGT